VILKPGANKDNNADGHKVSKKNLPKRESQGYPKKRRWGKKKMKFRD